jgi:hypothetical protein
MREKWQNLNDLVDKTYNFFTFRGILSFKSPKP